MTELKGKTALITGGGTGIGFGVAQRFLAAGAEVTIVGIDEPQILAAGERLKKLVPAGTVRSQVCDITNEQNIIEVIDNIDSLDIVVANAGGTIPGPILELDSTTWQFSCNLNIVGTALTIKRAALAMKQRGGSIVTVSSVAATRPSTWQAPYSASKAAVEMLTKCAAGELAQWGIRVNCIAPGFIETEATITHLSDKFKALSPEQTLLDRFGQPDDVADTALYLCSEQSRWVTGQVIGVDGGLSLHIHDYEDLSRLVHGDEVVDRCKKQ